MRRVVFLLAAVVAVGLTVAPASAAVVIDFEQGAVVGGTITYLSGGGAIGTNIPVDLLKVTNGATTTFYDLFGNPVTGSDSNGVALVNFNTNTGAFTIVGGVCNTTAGTSCPGTGTLVAAGTLLVNGTASKATIVNQTSTNLDLQEADSKDPALLTALGVPTNIQFALMDANFNALVSVPLTNTGCVSGTGNTCFTVGSVDIANTAVPEPASILLLGTVLVGVTQLVRRRARS